MRIRDDADRRIVRISLTEKGRAALERHEQFYYRIVDEAIRDMDNVQKRVLVRSMGHMADFFSAKLNQSAEETEAIGAETQPGEERFWSLGAADLFFRIGKKYSKIKCKILERGACDMLLFLYFPDHFFND